MYNTFTKVQNTMYLLGIYQTRLTDIPRYNTYLRLRIITRNPTAWTPLYYYSLSLNNIIILFDNRYRRRPSFCFDGTKMLSIPAAGRLVAQRFQRSIIEARYNDATAARPGRNTSRFGHAFCFSLSWTGNPWKIFVVPAFYRSWSFSRSIISSYLLYRVRKPITTVKPANYRAFKCLTNIGIRLCIM